MFYKVLLVLEIVCDIGDFKFQVSQPVTKLNSAPGLIIEVGNVFDRKIVFLIGRLQSKSDAVF